MLFRNQIKHTENVKQGNQKWLKQRYAVFHGEFESEKKKDKFFFDLLEQGFEPHIFGNFPAHDLNFHGR